MTPLTEIPENLHQAELALLSMSREPPETAWRLLSAVGDRDLGSRDLRTLKERAGLEKDEFERLLLWHGARQCLPRLELLEKIGRASCRKECRSRWWPYHEKR